MSLDRDISGAGFCQPRFYWCGGHGFWVGEDAGESAHIVGGKLAEEQAWGFEDLHGVRECFRGLVSDYNLRDGFP